jgi:hypothetical protein
MVSQRDYTADGVAACKSVLIELVHLMGEFRDHMVIVGGWVPVLLVPEAPEAHPGTLDIDLALDFTRIAEDTYRTILKAMTARGYRQDQAQPFRFFRTIHLAGGRPVEVEVDLLAGEYGGTGPAHRTQRVQDARARKARGCDLVFANHVEVVIEGELPGGGRDRVTLRVAALVPWIVMKGMALHDRIKEKDAFDIYYAVRNCRGGAALLVDAFRPQLAEPLIVEGLRKIRGKFRTIEDAGPKWVADFLDLADPDERAIRIRDAYESISSLLDPLGIAPWDAP